MARAFIGMGTNLGRRERNLWRALDELDDLPVTAVATVSAFHETAAVGPPQPDFLNAAAELSTWLEPLDLLRELLGVEDRMGRVRTERWGPRTIDLDLLLYDDLVLDLPDLKVPHPLLHERSFVLAPLVEIAPDVLHPVLKKTVAELREEQAEG